MDNFPALPDVWAVDNNKTFRLYFEDEDDANDFVREAGAASGFTARKLFIISSTKRPEE